jgi:hypothetical protein
MVLPRNNENGMSADARNIVAVSRTWLWARHGSSQGLWPRSWVKSKDGLECLNRAKEIEHNERNRQRIRQEQDPSDTNKADALFAAWIATLPAGHRLPILRVLCAHVAKTRVPICGPSLNKESSDESRKQYRKPGSCREETHGEDQVRGEKQFLKNGFTFSLSRQHVPFSFLPLFHLALFCAISENTS